MSTIGRPGIGPRVTFNITELQDEALKLVGEKNRSEWIRTAIDQRLARDGYRTNLLYAQDYGRDTDRIEVIAPRTGEVIDFVDVTPADYPDPYDDALAAAGWIVVTRTPDTYVLPAPSKQATL